MAGNGLVGSRSLLLLPLADQSENTKLFAKSMSELAARGPCSTDLIDSSEQYSTTQKSAKALDNEQLSQQEQDIDQDQGTDCTQSTCPSSQMSTPMYSLPMSSYHSLPTSPAHIFHSGSGSTTPTNSEFEDARSDVNSEPFKMPERPCRRVEKLGKDTQQQVSYNEITKVPDSCGMKRRSSRASTQSKTHSRNNSRRVSDFSEMELPPLELLFGPHLPHLHFHPEEETTPDENDLFPSTPLDEDQLQHADSQLKEELGNVVINTIPLDADVLPEEIGWLDPRWLDPRPMMYNAAEQAEEFAINVWHKFQSWKVVGFSNLPQWLQDNDFLKKGHRPPLPSFRECFKSIFRIHTETGNIWTHLLGVVAFLGLASYFITRPVTEIEMQEKIVFMSFFAGAIVCMGLSFTYHTVCCHQNKFIGKLFAKLDYCGIAFLTVGSFVPWLYYSFYCSYTPKVVYLAIVILLGILAVVVSLWDKFGTPRYRPFRAGVFIFFGLSGIAPATHYSIVNGWQKSVNEAALGWLVLMGALYITGAMLYAFRIPERFFPGKVDILFHSHQIFHCFVIAGAFVHYHGISNMALYRLQIGECKIDKVDISKFSSFAETRLEDVLV